MFCLKNKKYFCVLILLITIFIIPYSFAMDNSTSDDVSISDNDNTLLIDNAIEESPNNDNLGSADSSKSQNITLFIVSDNPGTNILDKASEELSSSQNLSNINLVIRSGEQIKEMDDVELVKLLSSCDGFVGEWISSDVDSVLTNVLGKYPELSNKKLFLILEPPSGKLNSGSSSIGLIRNNTINYQKIFTTFSDQEMLMFTITSTRAPPSLTLYSIRWFSIKI